MRWYKSKLFIGLGITTLAILILAYQPYWKNPQFDQLIKTVAVFRESLARRITAAYLAFQNPHNTVKTEYVTRNIYVPQEIVRYVPVTVAPNITINIPTPTPTPPTYYSGPELWEAVNKARIDHGVPVLSQKEILCTIASIRLNELLKLNTLDEHKGFPLVVDRFKDSQDMPGNVAEFLIMGYPTSQDAVQAWLNTLGHAKLLTGGEFVWGCTYAQAGFGVAIAGY